MTIDLRQLGLTEKESKIFEIILQHTHITTSQLSRISGVSRSYTYEAVENLAQKNFIFKHHQEGKTVWSVAKAEQILQASQNNHNQLKKFLKNLKSETKEIEHILSPKLTKPKGLVVLDMEGTIFYKHYKDSFGNTTPSLWTKIAEYLGKEALELEEETKQKWTNKEYSSYVEWMADTIKIHQMFDIKKHDFDKVIDMTKYHPNVKKTVETLHAQGYATALISGGFKAQADIAQKELHIDHSFAACEYFWNEKGELIGWNLLPCDYEGKLDFVKLLMNHYGFTKKQCFFIGDGRNDIHIAQAVGTSISFNGAKELEQVTTFQIKQKEGKEDFSEVLKFIK